MIPDINGIELVQRINQLSNHPVTVVMTGYGSVEMAVKAIKAGAFDFLSKPFSVDVLSATMASALRVPTRMTSFWARVTAVYNKLRCNIK